MNKSEQKLSKMLDQLKLQYEENKPVYEVIAAIPKTFQKIFGLHDEMTATAALQTVNNTGVTKTKIQLKAILGETAFAEAAGIFAWAKERGNTTIVQQMDITQANLNSLTDKTIELTCENIYKIGKDNVTDLADFGVTAETLEHLRKAIDAFVAALPTGRKTQIDRSAYTQKLKAIVLEITDTLKNSLDKLVVKLKKTSPDVYTSYQAARKLPKHNNNNNNDEKGTPPSPTK